MSDSRQDLERAPIQGSDGAEMPTVKRAHGVQPIPISQHHQGCVGNADVLIGIPFNQSSAGDEVRGLQGRQFIGTRAKLHKGQDPRAKAKPGANEVVKLGQNIWAHHKQICLLQDTGDSAMVGIISPEQREQATGVHDHASPNPRKAAS